ncbi:MAG: hypothetical protein AAGF87_16590 [Bacteroidota bacterium]
MLPKNDHILVGVLAGVLIPFVGYAILIQLGDWLSGAYERSVIFTPRTLALVGICSNVLVVSFFRQRYFNKAIKGVFVVTMVLAVVWFYVYGLALFGE